MVNANPNQYAHEGFGILGVINPSSQSAGASSTGWIAAKDYANFAAIVQVGALGSSATVDAKLQQASDSSGTGVKDVTGKAITQLSKAGTDDNKQVTISLKPEELDVANSFTHFRLTVTTATAASLTSAMVLGFGKRYGAANAGNAATVDEQVS